MFNLLCSYIIYANLCMFAYVFTYVHYIQQFQLEDLEVLTQRNSQGNRGPGETTGWLALGECHWGCRSGTPRVAVPVMTSASERKCRKCYPWGL